MPALLTVKVTPPLRAAADAYLAAWSRVEFEDLARVIRRVELKATTETAAARMVAALLKLSARVSVQFQTPAAGETVILIHRDLYVPNHFDAVVAQTSQTKLANFTIEEQLVDEARLFLSVFGSPSVALTSPDTGWPDGAAQDEEYGVAFKQIHESLVAFLQRLVDNAVPPFHSIVINKDLDVTIDQEPVELTTAAMRAVITLCLLGEKFTTEAFAQLYCNNTADPRNDVFNALSRLQKNFLPHLRYTGKGTKVVSGVKFKLKAHQDVLMKYLRGRYNTPANAPLQKPPMIFKRS